MSLPADLRPTKHTFVEQQGTPDCRRCGMVRDFGGLHPEPDPTPDVKNAGYRSGDVVLSPTAALFVAVYDPYRRDVEWLELVPAAAHAQQNAPEGAVLLVREGKAVGG